MISSSLQSSITLDSLDKSGLKIIMFKFYSVYLLQFLIDAIKLLYYAVIAYQIFQANQSYPAQKNEKGREPKEEEEREIHGTYSQKRWRLISLSVSLIIFELSALETLFQFQSQTFIFEIFTNINKIDTLLNLLIFSIYIKFYDCTDFLKIYQLNFLRKLLRILGINYNQNVTSGSHFWDYEEDHVYIQIVIIYQILFTAYKCWAIQNSHEIDSQSEEQISLFEKLNEFQKNTVIPKDQLYLGFYVKTLKNEKKLTNHSYLNQEYISQICEVILKSTCYNIQIFIEQFNKKNSKEMKINMKNQRTEILTEFKTYIKNMMKMNQKIFQGSDLQNIDLENFKIEEEKESEKNLKIFIENIQQEKLDSSGFTFSNGQILLKFQVSQINSDEILLFCQAFQKVVVEGQPDNQTKFESFAEEKKQLSQSQLKLMSTKNQVSFSRRELFENHQETLEKQNIEEQWIVSPIQAQEVNGSSEFPNHETSDVKENQQSKPQIMDKQQKSVLFSFENKQSKKSSDSQQSSKEKVEQDSGSVSIESEYNITELSKIASLKKKKEESCQSFSYTVQSNEQNLLRQNVAISKKIIKKESSNSIKSSQQLIKKRNPKILKKNQTSNVIEMRRGSVIASGIRPFKKSSKSLGIFVEQPLQKENDEIQILQLLEEQIQQLIQTQSQDSSKNIKHIQLFNCSNEQSIGDQSLNNQSNTQSKKNLYDQLHLIQSIAAQKKFLSNHNNELMNQEQKKGKLFNGILNGKSTMRKVSTYNIQDFHENKSPLNANSLNLQRVRSASISNVPVYKFGQKSQETKSQKPHQISQDLQNLIQFYEGKIDQKQTALDFYKKKTKEIQYSLDSSKIFLNMVVHDMRNPTNQLEFLVKQTLILLKEFKKMLQKNSFQNKNLVPHVMHIAQEEQKVADGAQIVPENAQIIRIKKNNSQQINNQMNFNNIQGIEQSKRQFSKQLQLIRNNKQDLQDAKNEEQKENSQNNQIQLQIQPKSKIQQQIEKSVNLNDNQPNLEIGYHQVLNQQNIEKFIDDKIQEIQNKKLQFQEKLKLIEQDFKIEMKNDNKPQNKNIVSEADDLIMQIEDQEPRITRELAKKLHLSFNPGLIFLNTLKKQILEQVQLNVFKNQIIPRLELIKCNKIYQFEIIRQESDQILENHLPNQDQIERQNIPSAEMQIMIEKLDQAVSQLENCKYCSVMLLNLINDMMDLAKTEQMKFELNNEFFDVTKTVERAFETLSYFGDQKNIKPKLVIDKQIEIFFKNIKGDENRFSQIFLNFLSNAFKFTPQNGSITLEICKANDQNYLQKIIPQQQQEIAQRKFINQMKSPSSGQVNLQLNSQGFERIIYQQEENGQRADDLQDDQIMQNSNIGEAAFDEYYISFQIRIKDSGMGISQENIGKLFLNFGKLADTQGVNKQGTGLGLSICKTLIEKMGGKVHVESEGSGKGTTFVITMQSVSKIQKQKEVFDMEQIKSLSIPERRISEELILKQNDVVFHQQKRAFQKGIMGSVDLSFQEQSAQRLQSKAIQRSSERQGSSKNLFKKMISIKKSKSPVHQNKHKDSFDSPSPNQNINNEQSQMMNNGVNQLKVLIINDEFFILQMLIMMVKSIDIHYIDTAQNGFDGFNLVKSNQYDFVICDLNMPVMDGFECCQQIKTFYENYHQQFFLVKVNLEKGSLRPYMVACSALINHQIEQKAVRSGFDLVVESPLTIELLQQIISKSSQHRQQEQQIFEQNKLMRQEINPDEEEKQELQQSNGRISMHQDSQVQDLINNLDQSIRYSHEQILNKSCQSMQSISNSDLDFDMNNSHESSYFQDQVQSMFQRGKQISKDVRDGLQPRISCNIHDKIEEEDDEVSQSDDSQSRKNILQSDELLLQLKISNENNEMSNENNDLQEESDQNVLKDQNSPDYKKESKESLMMKIKDVQQQNQIMKSAFSLASQSNSEQSSNNE